MRLPLLDTRRKIKINFDSLYIIHFALYLYHVHGYFMHITININALYSVRMNEKAIASVNSEFFKPRSRETGGDL